MGDGFTGEFFATTHPRHSRSGIRQLRRLDGSMTSKPDEMREIATGFYQTLLTEKTPSDTWWESRQRVLRHVRRMVTDEMQHRLLAPFTGHELLDALCGLVRDICPGEDALLSDFFIRHWRPWKRGCGLPSKRSWRGAPCQRHYQRV